MQLGRGRQTPPLSCYALADLLEEGGWPDLAFSYRWTGWYDRRPGKREGRLLRKRFVWYKDGAFGEWPSDESDRCESLQHARLDPLVYQALQTANSQFQLYSAWTRWSAASARAACASSATPNFSPTYPM